MPLRGWKCVGGSRCRLALCPALTEATETDLACRPHTLTGQKRPDESGPIKSLPAAPAAVSSPPAQPSSPPGEPVPVRRPNPSEDASAAGSGARRSSPTPESASRPRMSVPVTMAPLVCAEAPSVTSHEAQADVRAFSRRAGARCCCWCCCCCCCGDCCGGCCCCCCCCCCCSAFAIL